MVTHKVYEIIDIDIIMRVFLKFTNPISINKGRMTTNQGDHASLVETGGVRPPLPPRHDTTVLEELIPTRV